MLTKAFLRAGNAEFVLRNDKGKAYVYKIKYSAEKKIYYASLVRPSKFYIGTYSPDTSEIFVNAGSYISVVIETQKEVQALLFILDIVDGKDTLPNGWYLNHIGNCGKCGRKLTTEKSIADGIGPVCLRKL